MQNKIQSRSCLDAISTFKCQITWRASLSTTGPFPSPTLSFGSKVEYTSAEENDTGISWREYDKGGACIHEESKTMVVNPFVGKNLSQPVTSGNCEFSHFRIKHLMNSMFLSFGHKKKVIVRASVKLKRLKITRYIYSSTVLLFKVTCTWVGYFHFLLVHNNMNIYSVH